MLSGLIFLNPYLNCSPLSRSTFNTAAKASGLDKAMTDLAKECQDGIEELLGSTLGTQKGGKDAQVKAGTFQKDKVLNDLKK